VNSAILSLVGLVVGAVLQFLFTKHLDNKKHHRDVRSKAYADYLLCVSKQANKQIWDINGSQMKGGS
jgi:hypothetical protein